MKKYLLSILIVLACGGKAFSLEIVYPKKTPVTINSSSTFFIGSTNPTDSLKINDVDVKISPLGAFVQVVPLNLGTNKFKIVSTHASAKGIAPIDNPTQVQKQLPTTDEIDFTIERPQPSVNGKTLSTLVEYPVMNNFYVKNDNEPLRMTPIDGGINRLSHLPKNMQLSVNGEKGDFYRVYLNSKLSGWIAKTDIEQREAEKKRVLGRKSKKF